MHRDQDLRGSTDENGHPYDDRHPPAAAGGQPAGRRPPAHRDPERIIRRVLEPCIRGKFLRRLLFLGLDDQETIRAQLSLAVDWSEHEHLAAEKNHLHVDGRSMKQGAPELRGLLESFEDEMANGGLRIALVLHLRPGADAAHLRRLLGLRAAPQRNWAGRPAETSFPLRDLGEMTVTLALADDDRHGA